MRLIDADALIDNIPQADLNNDKKISKCGAIADMVLLVCDAPTIEAAPVVRGEWIRMDETQALLSVEWKCSQCGQEIRVDGILTAIGAGWKYCPNCGAKMESEGST